VPGRAKAGARFLTNRSARLGGAIVAALVAFALLGPLAAPHGPLESDFLHGLAADGAPVGPSAAFPLGADRLLRDELARLAYAGRVSLFIAVLATLIASGLGALVGIASGWYEGGRARVPWAALAGLVAAVAAIADGRPGLAAAVVIAAGVVAVRRPSGPRGGSGSRASCEPRPCRCEGWSTSRRLAPSVSRPRG
jgi:ABC-type dipeptide/oligopeptide/nickel transport system permease subunit